MDQERERVQVKTVPKLQIEEQSVPLKEPPVEPEVRLIVSGSPLEAKKSSTQTSVALSHSDEKSFCTKEIIKASQMPVMPTHLSMEIMPEPKDSQGPETESKLRQEEVFLPPPQLLSSVVEENVDCNFEPAGPDKDNFHSTIPSSYG